MCTNRLRFKARASAHVADEKDVVPVAKFFGDQFRHALMSNCDTSRRLYHDLIRVYEREM
jgi:hypothetical protein